jgi:hypothetical protein
VAKDREKLLFRFVCPECGVGDEDLELQVTHDDPHCMVCFMDDGRIVRLRRWTAEEPAKSVGH